MPKSKGTGPSTPKMNPKDKAKDSTLDASNNASEVTGIFTRSRSRRLSISLLDHYSPPKKARRGSNTGNDQATENSTTSCVMNESRNQGAKEKLTSHIVSKIAEEVNSKAKDDEVSKSTPSSKKRKVEKKGNRNVPVGKLTDNIEEQELSCKTSENKLIKSCKESVQDNVISGVPNTKRKHSRKSAVILEKIAEDELVEDIKEDLTCSVEPTKINGIGSINKNHKLVASADSIKKGKPRKSVDNSLRELTPKLVPRKLESPLPEKLEKTPQPVSKKSVTPAKLSKKKGVIETVMEKPPKKLESSSIQKLDQTPLPVTKKLVSSGKLSNKKSLPIDESLTPNKTVLPSIEKISDCLPVSKKPVSPIKLSVKKAVVNESTPKKMDLSTFEKLDKTPLPVLKKPASPVKLSTKKAVIEDDTDSDEDSDAESRKEIMRSAEKRIIRNLSTSESESRNHVKVLQLPVVDMLAIQQMETSSDSDSAPEDVTFDASRQSALELLKQTVDSIKRDKQKKKEKRKERLEIWRQRKEENLIRLKESKANKDDASCSSSEESLHERNGQLKNGAPSQGKKTYFVDEPSKSGLKRLPTEVVNSLPDHLPKILKTSSSKKHVENAKEKKVKKPNVFNDMKKKKGKNQNISNFKRDVDFMPLSGSGTTTFGVVALDKPTLKTVAQQAANFKHNLLFGSQICRVPTSTHINNRNKIQVNMK